MRTTITTLTGLFALRAKKLQDVRDVLIIRGPAEDDSHYWGIKLAYDRGKYHVLAWRPSNIDGIRPHRIYDNPPSFNSFREAKRWLYGYVNEYDFFCEQNYQKENKQ